MSRRRTHRPGLRGLTVAFAAVGLHVAVAAAALGSWHAAITVAVIVAGLLAAHLALGFVQGAPVAVRRNRRGNPRTRAVLSTITSAAGHAVLAALLIAFGVFAITSPDGKPRPLPPSPITIGGDDDNPPLDIEAIVDDLKRPDEKTPDEERAEAEREKEESDTKAGGQVVDIARPVIEERPDKADYVAEYDSKVERETKSRAAPGKAGAPVVVEKQEPEKAQKGQKGNPLARPGIPGPVAIRTPQPRRPTGLPGAGGGSEWVGPDGSSPRPGAPGELPRRAPEHGGTGGVPGKPGFPDLRPSEEALARAIGHGAGSLDYLKDVDDGESTALNAKKWKFASFFNRVKRAVADEWHPDIVYLRHDPSGRVYGAKDRVTILRVHLKPDGKLETVTMLQGSGVDFLDEEAMDAFRRAQPFPNPPPQLVDGDGLIHFNFGFIFELSGNTTFKLFKYQ